MLNVKDLTDTEFNILWDMFCQYRYNSITKNELTLLESMRSVLINEGILRQLLDNWENM